MSVNKCGFRFSFTQNDDYYKLMTKELDNFVRSTGASMTGTLNMNNNRIMNLSKPIDSNDAATKKYADRLEKKLNIPEIKTTINDVITAVANINKFDGQGNLNLNFKQVKNVSDPIDLQDVVTKNYLENKPLITYKLKIPQYEQTIITGELNLLETAVSNFYILIGKLDINSRITTRILNLAEMTQHYTDYQFITRCVGYVKPVNINTLINSTYFLDILIKENNIFLVPGIQIVNQISCLEFNTVIYLSKS